MDDSSAKQRTQDEIDALYLMLLIRRFEERAAQQYQMGGKIGGFCHLYIGQEAVVAGSKYATRPTDPWITAYRDHGHALAKGTSPEACMAELFGKATGCTKGLGGSMHYFDKPNALYGGHAIVGSHVPLGAGIAFAAKYLGQEHVTLCYMGDGAINIGGFHEGMNLAGLYKVPCVFICENNYFSMGTHLARSNPLKAIVDRAGGYNMASAVIDGMDFRTVRDELGRIVEEVRAKQEPYFVEMRTYRYRGHSMSDPATYRTKEELDKYKEQDPIAKLAAQLRDEKKLSKAAYDELDAKAKKVTADAVKFADESPLPPVEALHDYTFA